MDTSNFVNERRPRSTNVMEMDIDEEGPLIPPSTPPRPNKQKRRMFDESNQFIPNPNVSKIRPKKISPIRTIILFFCSFSK